MKLASLGVALMALLLTPHGALSQLGSTTQSDKADKRIKRVLDQAKLKYEVDQDGDFKLTYELENKRTQLVFINSHTEKYGEFEIREIWSVGYESSAPFSAAVANRLLFHNETMKLGAWQTKRLNNKYVAVFAAKVSAEMSSEQLEAVLAAIYATADEIEKELTGKDDF